MESGLTVSTSPVSMESGLTVSTVNTSRLRKLQRRPISRNCFSPISGLSSQRRLDFAMKRGILTTDHVCGVQCLT